jgi:hypothetical protein
MEDASKDRTLAEAAEAFISTIMDIHLTLEVKTFLSNSTPATGLSTESSPQKSGHLTDYRHRHRQKRGRERNLHTKSYKAKHERLHSTRLTRHDQAVNF